jgi:predicted MPP superfamily phosphohydrolase
LTAGKIDISKIDIYTAARMYYARGTIMAKISRRRFLGLSALAAAGLGTAAGLSTRLRITRLKMADRPKARFVHFSDFHYAGDAAFANEVVSAINQLQPDFVCFTGDLVENQKFLNDAFGFIEQIKAPVYGIPGNHDYWCGAAFSEFERAFAATGGGWLANRSVILRRFGVELIGMDETGWPASTRGRDLRHLLLMHYPAMAYRLEQRRYDLILAGHSHGGQVRVPFLGAVLLPGCVGQYDYGYYQTLGGPLYVNAGVGTLSALPLRVNCPPELTVVTI